MVTLIVIRLRAGIHRRRPLSWPAMDRGHPQDHHLQKRRLGSPRTT
jgi:hypothetical protein